MSLWECFVSVEGLVTSLTLLCEFEKVPFRNTFDLLNSVLSVLDFYGFINLPKWLIDEEKATLLEQKKGFIWDKLMGLLRGKWVLGQNWSGIYTVNLAINGPKIKPVQLEMNEAKDELGG